MRSLAKIEWWEAKYVYTVMRVAHHQFRSSHHHQMPQVAFQTDVGRIVVEVHPCHCTPSVSVDCLRCHFGKKGSHLFDYREPLPGVFRSQHSPCYAWVTQHPASALLRLWWEVSWSVGAFPSIAARENSPLAILAISMARHMSDCSSCTRPPCLAMVADMLNTSKKLVAASKVGLGNYLNHIRLRSLLQGD